MDTATSTRTRRIAGLLVAIVATLALAADRPSADRPALTVHGADAAQEAAIDWALHRFGAAGLEGMPPLDVFLHASRETCRGALGRYKAGRIDLCTKESSEPYARKFALHEMAHAWVEANIHADAMERFMEQRGLAAWNSTSEPWKERGSEQMAEIITWGLGEGEIAPLLPEIPDAATLTGLYASITGQAPLTPAAQI
jgi:hypothetical protein